MKIYQLIYTAVKHSLSDPELDLSNQAGYRVYSCTEGLKAEEINEIIRFCGYRLPKNSEIKYSKTPFDPTIPDKFPKTFRTFKTDSGKHVAIQVVYSGCDFTGEDGNFFAHALVIEDAENGFRPEYLYNSSTYRKWLTQQETEAELVRYLPLLEGIEVDEEMLNKVDSFINNHKIQMSVILEQALGVFMGGDKTHICISAKNQEESDLYILGLKRILPDGLADRIGISTNNIFLPSAGQNKIVLNGTISGQNNISDDDIERRTNCVYIDAQRIETDGIKPMKLFEMSIEELYKSYEEFSIQTGKQLHLWLNSFERLYEEGVGARLEEIYNSIGEKLFKQRALSVYEKVNQNEFKQVKFEILDAMFAHIELFEDKKEEIATSLVMEGIQCICSGEPRNIEDVLRKINKDIGQKIYSKLEYIMKLFDPEAIDEKIGTLLLRIFSILKSVVEKHSWREFFDDREDYMSDFLETCAKVMINDTSPVTFTVPPIWTDNDTGEVIALFDASTDDTYVKRACTKYIVENKGAVWSNYGITLHKQRKTHEEAENDIHKIRKLLTSVGYSPFQRTTYNDIKFDVMNEMSVSDNPILLVRLLYAFYKWQSSDGAEVKSEKYALKIAEMIMEMKETQRSLYNFVFPKLALEILDTVGLHHEIMINSETMDDNFWYWFSIGFKNVKNNEVIRANYERVAMANQVILVRFPFCRSILKR